MDDITPDQTLDCRGLSCPMPLLKTKLALKKMQRGKILEVLGTDPGTKNDIEKAVAKGGDELLGIRDESPFSRYYLRKG